MADPSPAALAKLIDSLLASPHYGERWARHWLDVARYGEDQRPKDFKYASMPHAYRYRDWVVRAFNENLPCDQFVRQQIAGDLMPSLDNYDGVVAVVYFALRPIYGSDGDNRDSIARARSETLEDRIDTLSRGFLGLTVVCARCHDHKFDPIPIQDFYSLAGVFNNTTNVDVVPLTEQRLVKRYEQIKQQVEAQNQSIFKWFVEAKRTGRNRLIGQIKEYIWAVWQFETVRRREADVSTSEFAQQHDLHDFVVDRWIRFLKANDDTRLPALKSWYELQRAENGLQSREQLNAQARRVAEQLQKYVKAVVSKRETLNKEYEEKTKKLTSDEKQKLPGPKLDQTKDDLLKAVFSPHLCGLNEGETELVTTSASRQQLEQHRAELARLQEA